MNYKMFKILKKDKKTKARLGILSTPHGDVKTPSYVFVGTYGKFRHLTPRDIKRTKAQLIIANTFHLWDPVLLSKASGKTFLTKRLGLSIPTMTDSGGFQVLSLAFGDKARVGKFMVGSVKADKSYKRSKVKITEKGVHFLFNGKWTFLGPELSMKLQERIGADIIFAFDHITSPLDTYKYNKKAVKLTDKWARICLREHKKNQLRRSRSEVGAPTEASGMLFGIVQGGLFKNLRIKSAKSIGAMPFDGFGIGGSYTKKQISKMLKWVIPHLPEEKPRHLLGVGKVADIFEAVQSGIDTFDCVIPTREARHGRLYTKTGHMDIRKGKYSEDKKIIEKDCACPTCLGGITRSQIRKALRGQPSHLVNEICNCRRQSLTKCEGQRWCLMHNMWFFNNLLEKIRRSIQRGKFIRLKKKILKNY